MSLVMFGDTGPKLTKFLHNVEESSLLSTNSSELRYSIPFRNASVLNEGGAANLAPKIDCHGNVPCAIGKKRIRSMMFIQSTIYHFAKNCEKPQVIVRQLKTEISLLK